MSSAQSVESLGPEDRTLLARLPPITRARGWRLYSAHGRRFLDLWSEGGRTVTGARPGGQGRLAKELIDRGLLSALPSVWEARLCKALCAWLPSYSAFRFYETEDVAMCALRASGIAPGRERPFGSLLGQGSGSDLSLVTLPLAAAWSFAVLAGKDRSRLEGLPPSDLQSPFKLAVATKAVTELLVFQTKVGEQLWVRFDKRIAGLFERRGPWLFPLWPASAQGEVFGACLEAGLLLSPDYAQPSFIPGEFDEGEIAALGKIPRL